jgi:thiosulfate/3-mercaptopyruvate sulfurtransferase
MTGLLLAALLAGAEADSLLVSTEWLARHRADPELVLLHVGMERAGYDRGHIPGARYLDPHRLMSMAAPGVELPAVAEIEAVLEELGIGPRSRIVYYGDTWMAPRVFVALEYVGLGDRTSLLDGGLVTWRTEGREVSTAVPVWTPGSLSLSARPEILAGAAWIRGRLGDSALVLLDGRSSGEYTASDSSEGLPRPGHIPGGVNLPWEETFENEAGALQGTPSRLKSPDKLRALLASAGMRQGRDLVTYCTVGLRASHWYFVARYLGYRPRLYDGSMSEWSRLADAPVVRGPSPR